MKLKNIYKLAIAFSALFAISPLLSYIIAQVFAFFLDCPMLREASIPNCPGGELVYTLFISTWFIFISLPLWIFLMFVFYLLYLSVRRR